MTFLVASLVLFSAILHAGWNFLVKREGDGQLATVAFSIGCSLIASLILPFVPMPDSRCYPWLFASLVIHVAYFLTLAEAYRHADLSLTYPLMRGMAPMLIALLAPLVGEVINLSQMLGVLMIGLGILLPASIGKPWQRLGRKGLYFSVLNAFIIALYTCVDGFGVRLSGHSISYTLWLFFFNSWGILTFFMWARGFIEICEYVCLGWRTAILGALMSMASYGIILWAMTQAPIPAVAALREMSVIFAALLGAWVLKERLGLWRMIGASMVGLGAAIIRWG